MSIHIERFARGSGRDDKQEGDSMNKTLNVAHEQKDYGMAIEAVPGFVTFDKETT
jgi:hypothetical protein